MRFYVPTLPGSPVSDDGRGLKQVGGQRGFGAAHGSPVSDDGRGLKLVVRHILHQAHVGSPVSDDGRGLKLGGLCEGGAPENRFARQ